MNVHRIGARVLEISARLDEIEMTVPEDAPAHHPLWREYERLMREWDDLDTARNVILRMSR